MSGMCFPSCWNCSARAWLFPISWQINWLSHSRSSISKLRCYGDKANLVKVIVLDPPADITHQASCPLIHDLVQFSTIHLACRLQTRPTWGLQVEKVALLGGHGHRLQECLTMEDRPLLMCPTSLRILMAAPGRGLLHQDMVAPLGAHCPQRPCSQTQHEARRHLQMMPQYPFHWMVMMMMTYLV